MSESSSNVGNNDPSGGPGGPGGAGGSANNNNSQQNDAVKAQQSNTSQKQHEASFNLNRLVLEYLTRKGFHQTEATLRIEATRIPGAQTYNVNNNNSNYVNPSAPISDRSNLQFQQQQFLVKQNLLKSNQFDNDPKMFSRAYLLYRSWCDNSLEMYKFELKKLLYPFFVHLFINLIQRNNITEAHNFILKFKSDHILIHSQEIEKLLTLNSSDKLSENKYSNLFLNNKYRLNLSNTSLNLILSFLNENQAIGGGILVRLLNSYFEIHTQIEVSSQNFENEHLNLEGIPEIYQLINTGFENDNENFKSSKSDFILQNEKPLKLGPYPNDEEFTKELEAELKHKDEVSKEKNKDQNKKSLLDEYNENFKIDPKNEDSPLKDTLPLPQKSVYDLRRAIQEIQDSRSRIKLSTASYCHQNNLPNNKDHLFISQPSLPSVCMYTFHNTNNDLTCLNFNSDSTMIAGGFQDSFIKLWSIDGSPLKSILKNDNYNTDIDDGLPTNTSRKLIGHSGPVYGLSYSPDDKFLLSSSADSTVRLWSMDTFTSLVSYKGHGGAGGSGGANSPVWDVEFSPLGHYFATASHDQTARLWSCDHIYPLRIFAGHLNDVDIVKFHPNGTYLFTGSSDKTIRMWDIARGESVRVFVGHTSAISDLACSPDGRWLASASVCEENYLNNSFGVNINGKPNDSDSVNSNNDKNKKKDNKNADDKKMNGNADGNNNSNNGNNTSGNSDKNINDNSNVNTKNNINSNNSNNISPVTFTGSVIYIWDIASGRKLKTLRGHGQGGIHSLAWSKGGEVLVSGGADGSVRVWDTKRGTIDSVNGGQPEKFSGSIPTSGNEMPLSSGSGHSNNNTNHNNNGNNTNNNNSNNNNNNSIVNNFGSNDHMAVYFTKKTPVYKVEFTRRNLCLAAGPFMM